jgi:outer membrane immunogenic protein
MRRPTIAIITGIAGFLISHTALSADMPVKAIPLAPTWTGFYVGLDVGYGTSSDPTVTPTGNDHLASTLINGGTLPGNQPVASPEFGLRGAFGGIEAGYNWQFGRSWVAGIETDFNASSIRGQGLTTSVLTTATVPPILQQLSASQNIQWFGTVRPRAGWLATDNLLLYGTGGFAYARVDETVNYGVNTPVLIESAFSNFRVSCGVPNFGQCIYGTSSHIATGWTAGGGVEYRVPGTSASIKAEYLFVSLAGDTVTAKGLVTPAGFSQTSFSAAYSASTFSTARLGLNWKF